MRVVTFCTDDGWCGFGMCGWGGVRFLGWLRVLVAINRRAVLLRKQPVTYDQQKKEPYNLEIMPRMGRGETGEERASSSCCTTLLKSGAMTAVFWWRQRPKLLLSTPHVNNGASVHDPEFLFVCPSPKQLLQKSDTLIHTNFLCLHSLHSHAPSLPPAPQSTQDIL